MRITIKPLLLATAALGGLFAAVNSALCQNLDANQCADQLLAFHRFSRRRNQIAGSGSRLSTDSNRLFNQFPRYLTIKHVVFLKMNDLTARYLIKVIRFSDIQVLLDEFY